MIGKKVTDPQQSATKRTRITALLTYMAQPERDDSTEKCSYFTTRGFVTQDLPDQIAEMVSLATSATYTRKPLAHYVLSWRPGEQPTPAQVDDAIDTLRAVMGIKKLLLAAALHVDTKSTHAHVAVLRIDPETERAVEINRGFDVDALLRAVTVIEHQQGWQVDPGPRWTIRNGEAVPADPDPKKPERPKRTAKTQTTTTTKGKGKPKGNVKPSDRRQAPQPRRDVSHRSGEPSVIEQAIDALGPALRDASGWAGLHAALDDRKARYDPAPNRQGGLVTWQGVTFKASAIDRGASLRALERRFGEPYTRAKPDKSPDKASAKAPDKAPDKEPEHLHPRRCWSVIEHAQAQTPGSGWQPVHEALARHGLVYEPIRSGARIRSVHDPEWNIPASQAHRRAARSYMEKACEKYEPPGLTAQKALKEAIEAASEEALKEARQQAVMTTTPAAAAEAPAAPAQLADFDAAAAVIKACIKSCRSWTELHTRLAAEDFRYDRKGSGATLSHGPYTVKASQVDRSASLGALQRRLGPYEAAPDGLETTTPTTAPGPGTTPDARERAAFERARDAYHAGRNRERIVVEQREDAELRALKSRHREERDEALGDDWTGRGATLNRLRQALAALQRAQLEALREQRRKARARHRERWPPFRDHRTWREGAWHDATGPEAPAGAPPERPADIRAYRAQPAGAGPGIGYWHADRPQRPDFIETGCRHRILQIDSTTVRASLQLHQAKGARGVMINGRDARFIELSIRHAVELGIAVRNPELQAQVARERARQLRAAAKELDDRRDAIRMGTIRRWHCTVTPRADGKYEYVITDQQQQPDRPAYTITDQQQPDWPAYTIADFETAAREMATLHKSDGLAGPVTQTDVADARASIQEIQRLLARAPVRES